MATTKKELRKIKIENLILYVDKIEVLNSFKRKNKGTKVSLWETIKTLKKELIDLKENL